MHFASSNFISFFGGFMKLLKGMLLIIMFSLIGCVHTEKKPEPIPTPAPMPAPVKITVVHFNFNSAKLDKEQKEIIKKAVEGKDQKLPISIIGYTDSQGPKKYNLKLSKKRAKAVSNYLKSIKMIGTISFEGKGEEHLLNADKTITEHKLNRRAEVIFLLK